MSIIVLGIEMPDTCEECRISIEVGSDMHCQLFTGNGHRNFGRKAECGFECRPDWCPLRPLPEKHGDLIDRDALPSRVEWEDIVNAPAIVGAEGEEPIKITGKIYFVDGHVYIDPDKEDKS